MIYYLRLLAAIAEANYAEAYWDAVAVSEWWVSILEVVTGDEKAIRPMKRFTLISLLLSSVVATPCHADDGLFWAAPHAADTGCLGPCYGPSKAQRS